MPDETATAPRGGPDGAEVGVALGWVAVGIVLAIAGWRMDRLESLGINPYSAPGLVPGIVGVLMALCGLILARRARRAAAAGPPGERLPAPALGRALGAAALCIVFGGLLPGRGLPFVWIAGVFVFVFMLVFGGGAPAPASRWRRVLRAAAVASVAALLITHLFGDVFLVRLP
jgi:hypothetical protein